MTETRRRAQPAAIATALRNATLGIVVVVPSLLGAGMAYAVILLGIGLLLYDLVRDRSRLRPETAGTLLLIAFALFAAASIVVAVANQRPGEVAFIFNFIALALFVPLRRWMADGARPGNAARLATLALAGAIVCLVFAIYETWLMAVVRAGASTVDPIRFAATAIILGFLSLVGVREVPGKLRWLYLLGPVAGCAALMLSGSRGAMLAVPLLAVAAAFYLIESRRRALLVLLGLGAAGIVFVLAAESLGFARLGSLVHTAGQILSGQQPDDVSTAIRLAIYKAGLAAFADSPLIGHGWSQITAAPQAYFVDPVALAAYSHLHNDVLDFIVATGIPGIAIYALIIVAPVAGAFASPRDGQRRVRLYATGILSGAYLVGGQSSLMFGFEYQTVLYVALAAIILGYCRDAPPGS